MTHESSASAATPHTVRDTTPAPVEHPVAVVAEAGGSRLEFAQWGGLRRFDVAGLSMVLHPATELEPGLTNLWLKVGDKAVPLLAPGRSRLIERASGEVEVLGEALGLRYRIRPRLADGADSWFWHVALVTTSDEPVEASLALTQDVALAPYATVRINEYYVSQYLDLAPVQVPGHGVALAVRQNMPGARVPWVLIGALGVAEHWATDALQLVDEAGARPVLDLGAVLPDARLQHEHALVALATAPLQVVPGETLTTGFFGHLLRDHPEATGPEDARHALTALGLPSAQPPQDSAARTSEDVADADADAEGDAGIGPSATSLFDHPALTCRDLTEAELNQLFGGQRRLVETGHQGTDEDGALWAFRADGEAVTLAAKERAVLRPHGHILRTGCSLAPETGVLTSTIWMAGVFASQVTQGHVSRGRLLSGRRTYLGLLQGHGLRAFVDRGQGPELLVLPSAWGLRPDRARWVYAADDLLLQVTATAPTDRHELELDFEVLQGSVTSATVALHVALGEDDGQAPAVFEYTLLDHAGDEASDGTTTVVTSAGAGSFTTVWHGARPTFGGDELLFSDGVSRRQPWLVAVVDHPSRLALRLRGDVVPHDQVVVSEHHLPDLWTTLSQRLGVRADGALAREVETLDATLGWFAHNALVHHLSPRGLEQFSGGGWGTRDVSQGPVGLLVATAQYEALRATLVQLLSAQNERGDWPQAFDFLPPGGFWGQYEAHGDVVFWPLLAIGEYLMATGDPHLLDQVAPLVGEQGAGPSVPVLEHLVRAVDRIAASTVPNSPLPAYGHGDWNDSLQPADPRLARQMASTWTATLQVHALSQLAAGLRAVAVSSADAEALAGRAERIAAATRQAMREVLMADGVLAGYGVFSDDGQVELLVHPRDTRTGLTWGVLPWIHAISGDQLTRDEAAEHLRLIRQHLWGPDGARLFDKPAAYRGGPMEVFQRAEAATFWGREIGLMYTHAHLRYAEALARFGDAAGLFEALMLAVPAGITERVPVARPRQSTCYYSSSDAAFADRAEAAERYTDLIAGEVEVEGGWRIYSSGPGLFLRLVVECLFGIRQRADRVEVDPVLDPRLDGLVATVPVPGGHVEVVCHVSGDGCGVTAVEVEGQPVATQPLANPYRAAGVSVDRRLLQPGASLHVHVGH